MLLAPPGDQGAHIFLDVFDACSLIDLNEQGGVGFCCSESVCLWFLCYSYLSLSNINDVQLIPSRTAEPRCNPPAGYKQATIIASFSLAYINMPLS